MSTPDNPLVDFDRGMSPFLWDADFWKEHAPGTDATFTQAQLLHGSFAPARPGLQGHAEAGLRGRFEEAGLPHGRGPQPGA